MKLEQAMAINNPKGNRVSSKGTNDYEQETTPTQQKEDRKKKFEEYLKNDKKLAERRKRFGSDEEYEKQCKKYDKENPS